MSDREIMNSKYPKKIKMKNDNKDYVGYSYYKMLCSDKIKINIDPIVNEVIKNYEKNKIPYLKSEIEDKVYSKLHKFRYDVMELMF